MRCTRCVLLVSLVLTGCIAVTRPPDQHTTIVAPPAPAATVVTTPPLPATVVTPAPIVVCANGAAPPCY